MYQHTAGGQHSHHLRLRYREGLFGDQQVDEAIGIREPVSGKLLDRRPAVEPLRADLTPGFGRSLGVVLECVHQVLFTRSERGCELSVAAAEMYDQAAFDAGGLKNYGCFVRRRVGGSCNNRRRSK